MSRFAKEYQLLTTTNPGSSFHFIHQFHLLPIVMEGMINGSRFVLPSAASERLLSNLNAAERELVVVGQGLECPVFCDSWMIIKGEEHNAITLQCDWKGIFEVFNISENALLSFWLRQPDTLFIIKVEGYVSMGEPLPAIPEQMVSSPPVEDASKRDGGGAQDQDCGRSGKRKRVDP